MIKKLVVAVGTLLAVSISYAQARRGDDRNTLIQTFGEERMLTRSPGLLQQAVMKMLGRNKLFLGKNDIDLLVSGRVRQEGFYFEKPLTFRDDYNDTYTFNRSKYNLNLSAQYGRMTYGDPALESYFRMTFFDAWDNFDVYTPVVEEPVSFAPHHFLKKAEISEHHHDGTVTHGFMEDGWLEVHIDKLVTHANPIPAKLRVGYFKHQVGRGVSLGTYFDGAINYLGWQTPGNPGNNTNSSPGIRLTLGDPNHFAFELYYSKWKKRSHGPTFTREATRAKRLDVDPHTNGAAMQRGVHADRDLASARFVFRPQLAGNAALSFEPYLVYVNAPELEIEFEGDACARLATVGCMAEYERNGWKFNVEVAGQLGHQDVHAIDRNHAVLDDDYYREPTTSFASTDGEVPEGLLTLSAGRYDVQIGQPRKYQSHVLVGMRKTTAHADADSEFTPYRAYYVNDEVRHINDNRTLAAQGDATYAAAPENDKDDFIGGQVHKSSKFKWNSSSGLSLSQGGLYGANTFKSGIDYFDNFISTLGIKSDGMLHNANIPFGGGKRFRKGYRLSCQGVMAMADLSYTVPNKSLTVSGAAAYISGADYPFNTEEDKAYDGFIPFKDADYSGYSVMSYAILAARQIGRPVNFSDHLLHAPINYESITNLQYVGVGAKWHPLANQRELCMSGNALYFWQPCPPYKWDRDAERDFGSSNMNDLYKKAQSDLNFTGHEMLVRASSELGVEFNMMVQWRPVSSLNLEMRLAAFIPGKMYSDIEHMPSALTIRHDKDGEWRFDGFGASTAYGGMLRMDYMF